jgi:hypothetical protein
MAAATLPRFTHEDLGSLGISTPGGFATFASRQRGMPRVLMQVDDAVDLSTLEQAHRRFNLIEVGFKAFE